MWTSELADCVEQTLAPPQQHWKPTNAAYCCDFSCKCWKSCYYMSSLGHPVVDSEVRK